MRTIISLIGRTAALFLAFALVSAHAAEPERETLRERLKARRGEAPPAATALATSVESITTSGDHTFSFVHDTLSRQYRIHIPKSYRPTQPTALVLALHGGGGGMEHMANDRNYGLISASERDGYIVVFPNGYSRFDNGKFATWNAGKCCGTAVEKQIDDVGFLREMIVRIKKQVNIDARRVYSIGMSNGAMMSYRLACEMPGVIQGIMAVAGTDNTTMCAPKLNVPVLHVHALNDDHVLFNGGNGPSTPFPGKVNDFVSVPTTVSKWLNLNHANATAQRVLAVPGAYCDLHTANGRGAPVKLCVTERGGHSWPGGTKARASEPPSQAINANTLMWEFFQSTM
jgi:polyhydroxybutyrate depolymerase